jgi:hypothetical protein
VRLPAQGDLSFMEHRFHSKAQKLAASFPAR